MFVLSLACFFCACVPATDQTEQEIQQTKPSLELTGRIVDQADLVSDEMEAKLVTQLTVLEKTIGPQFVIVTTDSLNGEEIEDYSLNLARAWEIGQDDRDDGVMLLVAPNERKVRIEVGYGLEGSLSDPFCSKVIRETMLPEFTKGRLEAAIVAGANRLIEKLKRSPTIEVNDNEKEGKIAA